MTHSKEAFPRSYRRAPPCSVLHIYERGGALARALQDYSNALWMGTLPANERQKATEGKQRVIAALGLNTPAQGSPQASAAGAQQGSSGGFFGMFDNVFGSSKPAAAAPPPPPPPPPVQTAQPAQSGWQAAPASSASGVLTRPKEADVQPAKPLRLEKLRKRKAAASGWVRVASIEPVAISRPSSANGFLIVFGTASNERAGHTEAKQIKAQVADILVARNLDLQPNVNGGVLIVAGPYKSKSAALALCSAMKQRGVRCQVNP